MRFTHVQSQIYLCKEDGRFYLFLRWQDPARHTKYQRIDFTTRAEAACFFTGALTASHISGKAVRFDALNPVQYQHAVKRKAAAPAMVATAPSPPNPGRSAARATGSPS
jgi:hypothetical protein